MIEKSLQYFDAVPKDVPQGRWTSLWFVPEGDQLKQYQKLLKGFRDTFGGPEFVPHMTYVGILDHDTETICRQTEEIASKHKPFTVQLGEFVSEPSYFRPIVVYGDNEPEELTKLHTYAHDTMKWKYASFRPHISMFYGNIPENAKKAVIDDLGGRLDEAFHVPGITVYDSKITEKKWEPIAYFPFKG